VHLVAVTDRVVALHRAHGGHGPESLPQKVISILVAIKICPLKWSYMLKMSVFLI